MPEVGDQIQVAATKVNQATRNGVVTDVRGRMITVQWATGDQSVFVPGPGTLTVLGRAATRPRRTAGRARTSKGAKGAIPTRPSTTTKKAAGKAPVRKTPKKTVAKATARQAPARKTTKKPTTQRRTTVTKKAGRSRVR